MLDLFAIWETLFGFWLKPWGYSWLSRIWTEYRGPSCAWPSFHSKGPSGWQFSVSVSPRVFFILEKCGETISELFYYYLSSSQQVMALRAPLFFKKPLASYITINGYTPEYHDRWPEVLVSKNVLLFCSGNSWQVSKPSPHAHVAKQLRGSPGNCSMQLYIFVLRVCFSLPGPFYGSLAPSS